MNISSLNIGLTNQNNVTDFQGIDYEEVFSALETANKLYPGFEEWFYGKVTPGVYSSERKVLLEYSSGDIAGIAIIKNTRLEKKLCNLTVLPEFQNKGIGLRLFEQVFDELNTRTPFLTVSEEKYPEFQRIFSHYKFEITDAHKGLYREGKVEYFLNEHS